MQIKRKPEWLKIRQEAGEHFAEVKRLVDQHHLHTICSSGKCPNMGHCWSMGTATFMILGNICTRSCKFCATQTGKPLPPDSNEPQKVAESVALMKLKHCVITSVDRDDLPDKGAHHWAETVKAIRNINPHIVIELLIPDFNAEYLAIVLESKPDIVAHNLETIERLTPSVRSKASYKNSMEVLKNIAQHGFITKTGIMVGLGETEKEVIQLLHEAHEAGCSMITVGQYLQPALKNIEVAEYVPPDIFERYKQKAKEIGYQSVESAPLVRSSYMAEQSFINAHF